MTARSNRRLPKPRPRACFEHRDAELGAVLVLRVLGERQVGHGDQLQAAVVDAEDFVAAEVELLCIAADLLVIGGIAKAQVAVSGLQFEQMGGDALAVRQAQRANQYQGVEGIAASFKE